MFSSCVFLLQGAAENGLRSNKENRNRKGYRTCV